VLGLKICVLQGSQRYIRHQRTALEVHGLDKYLDHGLDVFNRQVALAVMARNIQKMG